MEQCEVNLKSIGTYRSIKPSKKYELTRQVSNVNPEGVIKLNPWINPPQSLKGLEHFTHIWVIFQFNQASHWKPQIIPPRKSTLIDGKVGVLASRSPHRPNHLGLSAVQMIKIEKNNIYIQGGDLLDKTPILDIKPYLNYADAIPDSNNGWIDSIEKNKWRINFEYLDPESLEILETNAMLKQNIIQHLEFSPTENRNKRIKIKDSTIHQYELAIQYFRISFRLEQDQVVLMAIKLDHHSEAPST